MNPPTRPLDVDELKAALLRVHRTNDMLPPREDDKIAERIADSFTNTLKERLDQGSYLAQKAAFVPVAKTQLSTRPAAVLSLEDRVVYEALVSRARPKITRGLLPSSSVLWPRADSTTPAFQAFEIAPMTANVPFIVTADVAGFYESISHSQLKLALVELGCDPQLAESICEHLLAVMGTKRGLPQGVETSDSLATAYLSQADSKLRSSNIQFWRHGDDYRLGAATYGEALGAAHAIEAALRGSGLLANPKKMRVVDKDTFEAWLSDLSTAKEDFSERIHAARVKAAWDMSEEDLSALATDVELDEDMQWRYFYHGLMGLDEVMDALAPMLAPGPVDVVEGMFESLFDSDHGLMAEIWHARLTFCLQTLAGAKSTVPLNYADQLLISHPAETQTVANYLLALAKSQPASVASVCEKAIHDSPYMTEWQKGWILRVMSRCAEFVSDGAIEEITDIVRSDGFGWFERVEGARILAARSKLQFVEASAIREKAPRAFANDIVGIVAARESDLVWASAFLEGAILNPIFSVIIKGIRSRVN